MFELYLITFNCARNFVDPETLAPPLFDALPSPTVPDIVAVSLQEVAPIAYSFLGGSFLGPYFDRVTTTIQLATKLRSNGAEQLQHVATRSLGMTGLMIFAKPWVAERIQWIQSAGVGVGVWNMGNKGAVALRLGISTGKPNEVLPITITSAHLAPAESNVDARNKDWENIVSHLVFTSNDRTGYSSAEETPLLDSSSNPPSGNTGLFAAGNLIFFSGDLNYRTSDQAPDHDAHLTYPKPGASEDSPEHFSHWLRRDQLSREKEANRTLHGLQEQPIHFPPTYKYSSPGPSAANGHKRTSSNTEDEWRWAKHRYPSWCDRILFLPSPYAPRRIDVLEYTALPLQSTSDHRPVALFVRINEDPLAAGYLHFDAPFGINPDWRIRKDNARRMEVIVGALSYLALTRTGNAAVFVTIGVACITWWIGSSMGRA